MNQIQSNQSALADFGTPLERVTNAIDILASGGGVLVVDSEDRENEGDIVFAAETMTTAQMALVIREGTGIVCLSLPEKKLQALDLPQMVTRNTSGMGTAFTVSIEARKGVTTGVSAADRITTIRAAIAADAKPDDLARPGHVFPLRAHPGGVMARAGHTEASLELVIRTGHSPAAVLCELQNADGTMARLPEIITFARQHKMAVVTIEDLQAYIAAEGRKVA